MRSERRLISYRPVRPRAAQPAQPPRYGLEPQERGSGTAITPREARVRFSPSVAGRSGRLRHPVNAVWKLLPCNGGPLDGRPPTCQIEVVFVDEQMRISRDAAGAAFHPHAPTGLGRRVSAVCTRFSAAL